MRAVQVIAPGRAEFVETPKPEVKPGYALIRTISLALCGSDMYMLHYAPPEMYPFPPGTTGHELVGVVEAVDAPGSDVKVGDVALVMVMGQSAMAEYYLAPVEHVLVLPEGKPLDHLLQAQQLGTVIYACRHLTTDVISKDVAIIGQGSAGIWFTYMMRRMGARRVIALDLLAHRLMASPHYGATHTVNVSETDPMAAVREITGGKLADVVLEVAGEESSINMAHDLVKKYGDMLYFGVPHDQVISFNYAEFYRKCCRTRTIVGAMNEPGLVSTHLAIELIHRGEIDPGLVITHRLPFDRVLEAYELQHTRDEGALKIVVEME